MKIILAPSKTQNMEGIQASGCTNLLNPELTLKLFSLMQAESKEDLGKLLKLKGDLLEDTWKLYQDFKPENNGIRAIDCYKGVVFGGLECTFYNNSQTRYMNEHLAILSAMYGVISPETFIWPYRLDMTNKPGGMNLYKYWREDVHRFFSGEDLIINLSSTEYSRLLAGGKFNILNLHFMEKKPDGSLKAISFNAKKARGLMVNLIIQERIENASLLKECEVEGYHFDVKASDHGNYVFVR